MSFFGIWPTMVTPFTEDNKPDYVALSELVEWYIRNDVDGLFAICQSSEMFELSLSERISIAKIVIEKVNKRIPVVVSGHISESLNDQIVEITELSKLSPDGVILLTNRIAGPDDNEDTWIGNLQLLESKLPKDLHLGFYECPYPFPRVLRKKEVQYLASNPRYIFFKDTSCSIESLSMKLALTKDSNMQIFNANSATFLESLKLGAAGFCGVMANFHPLLYKYLFALYNGNDPVKYNKIQNISDFISVTSCIEARQYPVCAKYYLRLDGLHIELQTRTKDAQLFGDSPREETAALYRLSQNMIDELRSTDNL